MSCADVSVFTDILRTHVCGDKDTGVVIQALQTQEKNILVSLARA